jgi:hypothetical protein
MPRFLISALLLSSTCVFAADDGAAPAAAVKASNTICPISGKAIDSTIAPIEGKTKDGKTVEIGVCCSKCEAVVKKDPDQYADAAAGNKKADDSSTK